MDLLSSRRALRCWTLASVIANMAIIWTGALVRLSKSGLGCSTWPRCSPESYVPVPESGVHGLIEFGNRLLTFVLIAIAVGTALTARRHVRSGTMPPRLLRLAVMVGLGIVAQAVIGGVSVLTQLNPWVVGLHMVVSVLLIWWCVEMLHIAWRIANLDVDRRQYVLARVVGGVSIAVVVLGVIVTGAGPNAGDGAAQRNGLSLEWTAKTHAWSVWLVVALTVAGIVTAAADVRLRRVYLGLLGVELAQGAIGYVQYFNHLPLGMVLWHMVGTTLFVAAVSHLQLLVSPAGDPAARVAEPAGRASTG